MNNDNQINIEIVEEEDPNQATMAIDNNVMTIPSYEVGD